MLANVNFDKDLDLLADRGRLTIVGSRGSTRMDPRKMMGPELQVYGIALLNSTQEEWKEGSAFIVEGVSKGWVKPIIHKRYALEQAGDAHRDVMHSTGAKGKLVLSVQEEETS
ncbi:quinone oxidoreductase [Caerostris extrusa]|uniref:Quinone oxidoreductase n=1 Tax=Caerostris extrusa TaxID=172846 RepID=A0AAV4V2D0_CAEEX|nr:quinone oxidoreductase [Caerostris extrusa]